MKKRLSMVGALVLVASSGTVRAADFITAPVLVRQNELVTCQALNVGPKTMDVSVDLIDVTAGSIFGKATCASGTGNACLLASISGAPDDRLIYCRVTPGKKKSVRAVIQVSSGASAVAQ